MVQPAAFARATALISARFEARAAEVTSEWHSVNGGGLCPPLVFFQAEDGIRDYKVTGVQTCALPISIWARSAARCLTASISTWKSPPCPIKRCAPPIPASLPRSFARWWSAPAPSSGPAVSTTPRCPRATSASCARWTRPASARSKWPCAAWDSRPAHTTASSSWRAPSPTWANPRPSPPSTWRKRCSIAVWIVIIGTEAEPRIEQPAATTQRQSRQVRSDLRIPRARKSSFDGLPNARAEMDRGRAHRHVLNDSFHAGSKLHWRAADRAPGPQLIQKAPLLRDRSLAGRTTAHVRFQGRQFPAAQFIIQVEKNPATALVTWPHVASPQVAAVRPRRSTEAAVSPAPAPAGTSPCRRDNAEYRRSRYNSGLQIRAAR